MDDNKKYCFFGRLGKPDTLVGSLGGQTLRGYSAYDLAAQGVIERKRYSLTPTHEPEPTPEEPEEPEEA